MVHVLRIGRLSYEVYQDRISLTQNKKENECTIPCINIPVTSPTGMSQIRGHYERVVCSIIYEKRIEKYTTVLHMFVFFVITVP